MNQFKPAQVIMLPTENKSRLFLNKNIELIDFGMLSTNQPQFNNINQHLYITSDDEIKEGDWCYDKIPNEEGIFCDIIYQVKDIKLELRSSTERKIIATTNQNLNIK